MGYVARRLSSLAVVGAFMAFLGTSLLESAGLPAPVAIGGALLAFVATLFALDVAVGRLNRRHGKGHSETPSIPLEERSSRGRTAA
jgi:hypothetical protein